MFTGLVEEVGIIKSIRTFYDGLELTVSSKDIISSLEVGDSVAVDGVCQTAVRRTGTCFSVEAVGETLMKTTLRQFKRGRKVNLERSLSPNGRVNGHFVQGHIDGTGRIIRRTARRNHFFLEILIPPQLCRNVVEEGSIAIDGVSLTVASVSSGSIGISVIPYTAEHCTLGKRKIGDLVNIETDILGRYVAKRQTGQSVALSGSILERWGY